MTEDVSQTNSQVEHPHTFSVPAVDQPTADSVPQPPTRPPRRVHVKVLWVVVALIGAVAIGGLATFAATRPAMNSANSELVATQLALSNSEDKLVAQTEATSQCNAAADKSAKALDHWYSYMDDVQGMFLASTQADVNQSMTHLTGSYRSVVADKVPTAAAIRTCQRVAK